MEKAIASNDERVQVNLLTSKDPNIASMALLELSKSDPQFEDLYGHYSGCTKHLPCGKRGCPFCSVKKLNEKDRDMRDVEAARALSSSRNHQVRSAQAIQGFYMLPESETWFVTINLEAVALSEFAERVQYWRKTLQRILRSTRFLCIAKGRFEDDVLLASQLPAKDLSLPESLDQFDPEEPVIKLHVHMLLYAFDTSHEDLRRTLTRSLGGGNVVNIKSITHKLTMEGKDLQGIEGLARYSAKDHIKVSRLAGSSLRKVKDALYFQTSRDRRITNFSFQAKPFCTQRSRRDGLWSQDIRSRYVILSDWSYWDIESYLIEENIDELAHGGVSLDAQLDSLEEDYREHTQHWSLY